VLIISYETFRIHAKRFHGRPDACDLLICDEAHRLKNERTQTTQSLAGLACRRRVLLSGTPMQVSPARMWWRGGGGARITVPRWARHAV
jgi:DNA repair and recombination RAD54-like protein